LFPVLGLYRGLVRVFVSVDYLFRMDGLVYAYLRFSFILSLQPLAFYFSWVVLQWNTREKQEVRGLSFPQGSRGGDGSGRNRTVLE
jgi:hypothetical protein